MKVWTVGHSTQPFDAFVALLAACDIAQVADIRAVPRSRRQPQFDTDALARSLPERGVAYVHLPRLGGWRQPERGLSERCLAKPVISWVRRLRDGRRVRGRPRAATRACRGAAYRHDVLGGALVALSPTAGCRPLARRRRHGVSHQLTRARLRAPVDAVRVRRARRTDHVRRHVPGGGAGPGTHRIVNRQEAA